MNRKQALVWIVASLIAGCTATVAPSDQSSSSSLQGEDDEDELSPDAGAVASTRRAPAGRMAAAPTPTLSEDGGLVPAPGSCGSYGEPVGSTLPAAEGSFLEFEHDGLTRKYKIYVPSNYRNDTPLPVLFMFHGLSGTAEGVGLKGTDLDTTAEENGFILVLPSGYKNSWNAGTCCAAASDENVDDVGFIREVHRRLVADLGLCVDSSRTYVSGYSNGAYFAYRLACEASDLFAAAASVGGTMVITKEQCAASMKRPVPLLEIHGLLDWISPFNNTDGRGTINAVKNIASVEGCSLDTVPSSVPKSAFDTFCNTYPNCREGSEVTLCQAVAGGHCWYGSPTCGTGKLITSLTSTNALGINASKAVWAFLSRIRCPQCGK